MISIRIGFIPFSFTLPLLPLTLHSHPPPPPPLLHASVLYIGIAGRPQPAATCPLVSTTALSTLEPFVPRYTPPPVDDLHGGHHARQVFGQMSLSLFSNDMSFFRVRRMVSYSTMEDELLCDAWLAVSVDFIVRTRGPPYWEQVHEKFHAEKHIAPYDMYIIQGRTMRPLLYCRHAI